MMDKYANIRYFAKTLEAMFPTHELMQSKSQGTSIPAVRPGKTHKEEKATKLANHLHFVNR
jgi:hypothetical protein